MGDLKLSKEKLRFVHVKKIKETHLWRVVCITVAKVEYYPRNIT
jgi:hypothetical protein